MSFGPGFISGGIGGNDTFTKALLHFDGTNGSTTFTDVNAAGLNNTWTRANQATISTSNVKFGTAVLASNSVGGISTPYKLDFWPGSSNFTVDFWYNPVTANSYQGLAFLGVQAGPGIGINYSWSIGRDFSTANNRIVIQMSDGSNQAFVYGTTQLTSGWHHIAMVRNGNTGYLYVDGIQETSVSFAGNVQNKSGLLWVGADCVMGSANCLIDEFRYSVGIARWTSNFTPPNQPYS